MTPSPTDPYSMLRVTEDTPLAGVQAAYDSLRARLEQTGEWTARQQRIDDAFADIAQRHQRERARQARMLPTRSLADRLGVSPAAVANYAKRFEDFPQGVKQGRYRLYDPYEVRAWAHRHDRPWIGPGAEIASTASTGGWSDPTWRDASTLVAAAVAGGTHAQRREMRDGDVRAALSLAAHRWAEWWQHETLAPSPREVLRDAERRLAADEPGVDAAHVRQSIDRARNLAPAQARDVVDREFSAPRIGSGRTSPYASEDTLTAWVLAALGDVEGPILDPACGTGGFLCELVDRFGPRRRLVGIDVDETAAWRAAVRLGARGASARLGVGDAMTGLPAWAADSYDAVVVDPPHDTPWDWVERADALRSPQGRAVVTVPFRALTHAQMPADTMRDVRAVVGLPGDVKTGVATDLVLVVLGPAPDRDVLFVSGRHHDLTGSQADSAHSRLSTLLYGPPGHLPSFCRTVARSTLALSADWSSHLLGLGGRSAARAISDDEMHGHRDHLLHILGSDAGATSAWPQLARSSPRVSLGDLMRRRPPRLALDSEGPSAEPRLLVTPDHAEPLGEQRPAKLPRGARVLRLVDGTDAMAWVIALAADEQLRTRAGYRVPVEKLLDTIIVPDLWTLFENSSAARDALDGIYETHQVAARYVQNLQSLAAQV